MILFVLNAISMILHTNINNKSSFALSSTSGIVWTTKTFDVQIELVGQ